MAPICHSNFRLPHHTSHSSRGVQRIRKVVSENYIEDMLKVKRVMIDNFNKEIEGMTQKLHRLKTKKKMNENEMRKKIIFFTASL